MVIVGGATGRLGSDRLWTDPQIELISCNISNSPSVSFVADAHDMSLAEGSVDRVWIQAVLEHILEPALVESKIQRLLGPDGLAYAQTRFMQVVYEFQHDFFWVSHSAHCRLSRGFDELKSGPEGSAGTVLNWSIKYLVWCLTGSRTVCRINSSASTGGGSLLARVTATPPGLGLRPVFFSGTGPKNGARTTRYDRLVRSP
jgi:Methyltransferase domain